MLTQDRSAHLGRRRPDGTPLAHDRVRHVGRRRLVGARTLLAAVAAAGALAALPSVARADGGTALLEIGRLSDGTPTGVSPASLLSGLDLNEGAGGRFGVTAGAPGTSSTFAFAPPADTTIRTASIFPSLYVYGWPAMGTWTEIVSSWGDWNVGSVPGPGGIPGESSIQGLWAQGGSGITVGAIGSLSATVRQTTSAPGPPQTGYFYADKLNVALTDSYLPEIDAQPDTAAPLGTANPSGWYTGAEAPLTMTVSDRGVGVRYLLVRDGANVHRYEIDGAPASCQTKDPNSSLLGGDSYTVKVPCPTASASSTARIALSDLGDGVHSLSFGVQDAAGNIRWSLTTYVVRTNGVGGTLADPGTSCHNGVVDDSGTCIAVAPSNISPPWLTGFAAPISQGQTIYRDSGTWDHVDGAVWNDVWELCEADGSGCLSVPGGTGDATIVSGDHITLGADAVGKRLRASVTATTNGGAVTARSVPSAVIAAMAPVNTVAPALSGLAQVGGALTTTTGTWTGTTQIAGPTTIRWQRCDAIGSGCTTIAGASGATYVLSSADAAHTVRSSVRRVNNGGGSATAFSSPSPIVFPSGGGGSGGAGSITVVAPVRVSGGGAGGGGVADRDDPTPPVPDAPAGIPGDRVNGANPAGAAVALAAGLEKTGVLRSGQAATITGRLATRDGQPVAGAQIDVLSHLWMAGARGEIAGAVTTGPDGTFTVTVKPGPSRVITLGYRLRLADRAYTATVAVKVAVRPAIVLRADRSSVTIGDTVTLSGRLGGAPAGSRKLAQMQARVGGRWVTFATTPVVDGRFRHRHRFSNTTGTRTYLLRARVGTDPAWPFATSASRAVRVTVSAPKDRRSGEDFG